jgi:hypothetical protein
MPDEHFDMPLVFDRENTVFIPNRATTAFNSNRTFYGLTIKNHSARKLFTYLIYFDPSDYSIQVWFRCLDDVLFYADPFTQSWYQPPSGTIATPLAERRRDGRPSELPVGYGSAGGDALEFSLADGITADIGFLKIFVSTSYVDMSALEQESPFHAARGTKRAKPPSIDLWDTWTCVLRTQETGE